MINIFVPLKDGEALMPEVMQGILSQSLGCCIVPITSKGEERFLETNKVNNLLRALSLNKTDKIILMDSDVCNWKPVNDRRNAFGQIQHGQGNNFCHHQKRKGDTVLSRSSFTYVNKRFDVGKVYRLLGKKKNITGRGRR